MKKNESNGDEARYQTTDSSIEADATVAKKDIPKMRIAIGLAIGAAVGVGIGLLVGRKLDFGPFHQLQRQRSPQSKASNRLPLYQKLMGEDRPRKY